MDKLLEKLLARYASQDQGLDLPHWLFSQICFAIAFLCFFVILPLGLIETSLPVLLNLADIGFGLFALFCFTESQKGRHRIGLFLSVLIVVLNVVWFFDAGTSGSTNFYFFAAELMPVVFLRGRSRWLVVALILLNACALNVLGFYQPDLVTVFHTRKEQILDVVIGLFGDFAIIAVVVWVLVTSYDIERKRLLETARYLQASEEKFSKAFRSTFDGIGIAELETGRFIEVNDGFTRIYGFTRDETVGRTSVELGLWKNEADRQQMIRKLQADGSLRNVEFLKHSRGGTAKQILLNAEIVEIGGKPCIISLIQDITDRKRAELLANGQKCVLEMIASDAPIHEILDTLVRVLEMNEPEMLCSILLLDQDGLHLRHGAAPSLPEAFVKAADGIPVGPNMGSCGTAAFLRKPVYVEDIATDPLWEGARALALPHGLRACWSTPIFDAQQNVLGTFAIYYLQPALPDEKHRQIIELATHTAAIAIIRQRARAALQLSETKLLQSQKMEAIGQLAGGVAHDFNNILSALLMQVEILIEHESSSVEARKGLEDMRNDINRATELTRQLLLFSRRQVMQPRQLNLNALIMNLGKMLQRIVRENVQLQLNLHASSLTTRADSGMIEQILLNLVVNACDAMPDGGRLRIETLELIVDARNANLYPDAPPGSYVGFGVSDTGGGIPTEILPQIFEPFFTTKKPGKGTGLGLATVFGIVKQHQGWIKVDNQPGGGVTFRIFLPASNGSNGDASDCAPPELKPKPGGGTETILLVEDDDAVRNLIDKILVHHGYKVLKAVNGLDAQNLWRENCHSISLLLTDLVMPGGLSGQDIGQQFRNEKPGLKSIFVSGYSPDIAGKEFKLLPGEIFMQKPFAFDRLLEKIRQLLDS